MAAGEPHTPDRVDAGPIIAGIGALVLLVSLFLDWYDPAGTAWAVFEVWDLVLAAIAAAVIVAALGQLGARLRFDLGARLLPALGVAALVIVASQLVNEPPAASGSDVDSGGWLALTGAALLAVGGLLSVARVSLDFAVDGSGRDREEGLSESRAGTSRTAETAPLESDRPAS